MRTLVRPNVLLLYTDQQRWDSLGCYGNVAARTPHLDQLAAEGTRLMDYYVQNPVCMPSRMSFLTGRYCSSLGVGTNGIPFPAADAEPINRVLKPYGYTTAQIGKLHFQPHLLRDTRDPYPDYGFDTAIIADNTAGKDNAYMKWVENVAPEAFASVRRSIAWDTSPLFRKIVGPQTNGADVAPRTRWFADNYWFHSLFEADEDLTHSGFVADQTCRFLEEHRHAPFFAIAGFFAPHAPINPPQRFLDLFDAADMPLPRRGDAEPFVPTFLSELSPHDWQEIAAYYAALVAHVDDCVGQILRTLDATGRREDTIVIFTSDHGEYLGDHGRVGKAMPGHDCIVRVPFLVRYPGHIRAGAVSDALVEAVDVVPTILDYCGVQVPRAVQGRSFKGAMEGQGRAHREDVFVESFAPHGVREATVRTRHHKYYCSSEGAEILYDLERDPGEGVNCAADGAYAPVLAEMRKRMIVRLHGAAFNTRTQVAPH